VIATYGVLSNSTATVIGAMIVAPLMGPIMATSAAVIMGSTRRAVQALFLALAGILAVIALSFLLAWLVPDVTISFTSNGEIASRINPGLYALATALGAGAAGAFITSRAEIADSMGGVAIAISLVPPLCVVGISLQQGRWDAAGGAMLLFLTNFFAILLTGGIAFAAVGLGRVSATQHEAVIRRRGMLLFAAGILLVTVPLAATTYQAVQSAIENNRATSVVEAWLAEGQVDYRITTVQVKDQVVSTTLEGSGPVGSIQDLARRLAAELRHPVAVSLRLLPAQTSDISYP
jgi:uncharacterized hydrophobic protein (TIGR00271 family)